MRSACQGMVLPTVAVALATSLAACTDGSDPRDGVPVEDVADRSGEAGRDPERDRLADSLAGQSLTISAQLEDIVSPQAFRIGPNQLLVVSTSVDFSSTGTEVHERLVQDDAIVRVTGVVRRFDLPGFEEEFRVDYDDELFASFQDQPVIVAESVMALTGKPLRIAGDVEFVTSPVSFRLTGADWEVVVLDAGQAMVDDGRYVEVTGTVRQFDVPDVEEELGLELDDELYGGFSGKIVLVAHKVTTSAPAAGDG